MIVLRWLMWLVAWFTLPRRYAVRVHGREQLRDLRGPTLFLPSHPAYVDPMLVLLTFWPQFRLRPLLAEGMFNNPLFRPLMYLVNAVRLPDLLHSSAEAQVRAEKAVQDVIDGLRRGENLVMWPAGRVERRGNEILGGASALARILQSASDVNIVLIRTLGLWGSRFSYAYTGSAPSMAKNLLIGVGWLLASLWFFTPRRRVDMTIRVVQRQELPELDRTKLNPWLEAWYNAEGKPEPKFVRYHYLFGPRSHHYPPPVRLGEVDLSTIKPETIKKVNDLVGERLKRPLTDSENKAETTLDQLGLDSLERMELALDVERTFGFSSDDVPMNLGQLWALAQGQAEKSAPKPPPPEWFRPPSDTGKTAILGETVVEAFVDRALANPKDIATADDLAGVLSFEKLLVGAIVMSRRFAQLPGKNIGLLLPASVACDVALMGMYLAGKLPVVLNWTTGPGNLAHAAKLMELQHVVTSKTFLDRTHIEVAGVEYFFLEELRKSIGWWEKLRTLLAVRWASAGIRGQIPTPAPDEHAVVLFTSGSEKTPKAVPLTHRNLISNQRAGIDVLGLMRSDSVLGFLPSFHSFGLSITGLMTILTGVKVVRHPDPTDSARLVWKIANYKPTLLLATPTFLHHIFERAKPGELSSLRIIIVGAEKCPPALFDECRRKAPQATLIEGYGITECGPCVAANSPEDNHPGTLGRALPGVELCVVDPETGDVLPPGKQGMLLVHGPNVFLDYIGQEGPSPFRELNGKRWYVTGDLVEIDNSGLIRFGGRRKRFLKAGGEMISLPALEEPFTVLFPPTKDGPRVAVEGIETGNGRHIVLFATEPITLSEANAKLRQAGHHGILRLDEVRRVPSIPVLGTGKTDYKVLRAQIEEKQKSGVGAGEEGNK
jgi:long-chain-fatty-acid--[acyl-carrier-protein] ligase